MSRNAVRRKLGRVIASRILYRVADVDRPERDLRRRLGPTDAGWDIFVLNGRHADGWSTDESAGGAFSIKWMAEGRANYRVEGRPRAISREAITLVDQGQPYALAFEPRPQTQSYCLFFAEPLVREAWASQEAGFGEASAEGAMRGFPSLTFRPTPMLIRQLARMAADGAAADDVELEGRALLALGEAVAAAHGHRRLAERAPAAKASTRAHLLASLERARTAIEDSRGVGVNLALLSRQAGLSRFHLLRLFKAVYGVTPMAFAERLRIERAAATLRVSSAPIAEVAADFGYDSPSAFAKAFRRRKGAQPSAWRN